MRIIFAASLFFSTVAHAQILVDEGWGSSHKLQTTTSDHFSDTLELKARRKLGLQLTAAGATGLAGINADLNFTSRMAFSLGVGVSRGFRAINSHIKYSLGGKSVSPYFVGGFSRWYSNGDESGVDKTSPSLLKDKFLTRRERETGDFAENILYPGIGVQYLNTTGDWVGIGFFGELLLLMDIDDFALGPTAGAGTIIYF